MSVVNVVVFSCRDIWNGPMSLPEDSTECGVSEYIETPKINVLRPTSAVGTKKYLR